MDYLGDIPEVISKRADPWYLLHEALRVAAGVGHTPSNSSGSGGGGGGGGSPPFINPHEPNKAWHEDNDPDAFDGYDNEDMEHPHDYVDDEGGNDEMAWDHEPIDPPNEEGKDEINSTLSASTIMLNALDITDVDKTRCLENLLFQNQEYFNNIKNRF